MTCSFMMMTSYMDDDDAVAVVAVWLDRYLIADWSVTTVNRGSSQTPP
eukprot:CAMPEP_0119553780 /NCGR_PEP_ID=MMETSP1352-20130426/6444_1 /TAXON_ID=265584 /ORGANISM="Stauroneis constricta, Strain CCMP1120" /LENGTH=47 /DNA_ID= /DNA_START= /DNA_END= /DNA_ORIENTATION=